MRQRCNADAGAAPTHKHSGPLAKFTAHRRFNAAIARDLCQDPDTVAVGRRIHNCAPRIGVEVQLRDGEEPETKLVSGNLCNARLCPMCEWRRTRVWRKRLISGLEAFHLDYPTWKPIFLTLTVRNVELSKLRDEIKRMNAAWGRFAKASNYPTEMWFRRTEVVVSAKRRPTGSAGDLYMAHPHFHCLLLVPPAYFSRNYLSQRKWQEMWAAAGRLDYAPVVDVRNARAKSTNGSSDMPPLTAASLEAAKYASKATNLLELGGSVSEFHRQVAGLRFYSVSQRLSEYIKATDVAGDDMLDTATQPVDMNHEIVKATAQWFEDSQEYLFTDIEP